MIVFSVLLFFFLSFHLSCFTGALLLAWPPGSETILYDQDLQEEGKQTLKRCFGEDSLLSEGVEKEYSYFNDHDRINVTIHYTEWTLSYQDARGQREY